jgi:hypothetical protein
VYSCTLFLNSLPHRWRTPLNDDTDINLQVLASGWCTILVNCFSVQKQQTMKVKGGNTGIYVNNDGRLKMARSLERLWPGVVEIYRRFGRPQHKVKWSKFDTPLKRRADVEIDPTPNEYGLTLNALGDIESRELRELLAGWQEHHADRTTTETEREATAAQ